VQTSGTFELYSKMRSRKSRMNGAVVESPA